jgi:hypothetical protein
LVKFPEIATDELESIVTESGFEAVPELEMFQPVPAANTDI